ncbi:Heterokaryon incompatibility [Niveomyces insectorum RCEF 264]|uniref:Heterokaryon incompatibility n=1 Tax=Niveomyces insectorum RCEF 264 TaxID=1081102 RepID=A0A167W5P6_9HYPO|nr:Heterokaryon incompatibility [Niveomyces insectorum RCEF 264]
MRLLRRCNDGALRLERYTDRSKRPPYAILSHTWGSDDEEVTYKDMLNESGTGKVGYEKIRFCAEQAMRDGLEYFWVDTCCIDKENNAELAEAINSMFRWYQESQQCYVYLADVSVTRAKQDYEDKLRASKWFTRGWTLQELLAPKQVHFFSREGRHLGDKSSLEQLIHESTGVDIDALRGRPMHTFDVEARFNWAKTRRTTRDEDWVYCLLGIFGVFMPPIYGEGRDHAAGRLREQIDKRSSRPVAKAAAAAAGPDTSPCWMVPFGRNKDFVGRETILAQLLKLIPPDADTDGCQQTAIEGLGGIGKTQIALEAAFRVKEANQNCSVFWVPAMDTATFEKALYDIGRHLRISGLGANQADVKSRVKAALSQADHDWLLVVDNADDAAVLGGIPPTADESAATTATPRLLHDWCPTGRHGSVLLTTRDGGVVRTLDIPRSHVIRVPEMGRDEATKLLQRSLGAAAAADLVVSETATQLLDFLADLPLAIRQASAYMTQTGMTAAKYLAYCQKDEEHTIALLSKGFADRGRYKTGDNAIAKTWLISFRRILQHHPLAAQYLQFMSFLGEKDIPRGLLPPADNDLEMDEAVGVLLSYGFLSRRSQDDVYDMHRLVALATRNWLAAEGTFDACIATVVQRLNDVFPFPDPDSISLCKTYLPHTQKALRFYKKSPTLEQTPLTWLFESVAATQCNLGKYADAEVMFREAFDRLVEEKGAEHQETLRVRINIASCVINQGRYGDAVALYRETLALCTEALGAVDLQTLRCKTTLAMSIHNSGDIAQAEIRYKELIAQLTQTVGAEHDLTLLNKRQLANLFCDQGRYAEGEALLREVYVLQREKFGAEHFFTIETADRIAISLISQRKWAEAKPICLQTLEQRTKTLGPDHPDTLQTELLSADILRGEGKYAEAEVVCRRIVAKLTATLGAQSVLTMEANCTLAHTLVSMRRFAEAEVLFSEVYVHRSKVFGSEHPNTLQSATDLANGLRLQEKWAEAERLARETLAIQRRVLGDRHPDTLRSKRIMAACLAGSGKHAEGELVLREVLETQTSIFGAKDSKTLATRGALAQALFRHGKVVESEAEHRETLAGLTDSLGAEHPESLQCSHDLAVVLAEQAKYVEAEVRLRTTLALRTKTLGADNIKTLQTAHWLTFVLHHQGKLCEAETLYRNTLSRQENTQGASHPDTIRMRDDLAILVSSRETQQHTGAGAFLQRALRQAKTLRLSRRPKRVDENYLPNA